MRVPAQGTKRPLSPWDVEPAEEKHVDVALEREVTPEPRPGRARVSVYADGHAAAGLLERPGEPGSGSAPDSERDRELSLRGILGQVLQILAVFQVLVAIALTVLVLMHSGRDTGFGGLGFTPMSHGGQHVVERNLTRLTVVVATVFGLNTVLLFHLL
jgi:protein translocase SecG subunit